MEFLGIKRDYLKQAGTKKDRPIMNRIRQAGTKEDRHINRLRIRQAGTKQIRQAWRYCRQMNRINSSRDRKSAKNKSACRQAGEVIVVRTLVVWEKENDTGQFL